MKKKSFRILSLIMALVMVLGSFGSFTQTVQAAEDEYEIYPIPHSMTYQDGSFAVSDVNVVLESGIDSATKARLEEAAAEAGVTSYSEADAIAEDKTNILVGIEGSGEYVDTYFDGYEVTEGLFDKLDSYVMVSNNGVIAVLGKDADAAFYGVTTLYHIATQLQDGAIRNFIMEDYADVASRGFIEGYYGNPWSVEDRCKLMEWGGYYKLNSYFYAPKDDPKHNSNWRELYTEEEIETKIKPLAEAGNASKCRFVFALHPYMYNAIRYNSEENYQADLAVMQAKFEQVIEAGVRQIAILADDAGNVGSSNYIKTLQDMTAWIQEMQETYPDLKLTIPFCTQEYMGNGQSYYANFPENIQIVMTGGRVWGEVSNSFTNTFTNNVGRGPYMWINWPCTDNSKKHLIMGGYTTFLHAGVDPSKIQGIVLNPMQQSEPSKVAIFGNACYSWNIWESNDEANMCWNDSFKHVDHKSAEETAASNALRELSKHMINQNMDSRVTKLEESVELKPLIDDFKAKLTAGTYTVEDADALIAEFEVLQQAAVTYRAEGDSRIKDQIVYWLNCWDDTTAAVISYLNAAKAIINEDENAVIWDYYSKGQERFEASRSYGFHYVDHTEYAEVGVQHIVPLMEALDEVLGETAATIVNPTIKPGQPGTSEKLEMTPFHGGTAIYSGSLANVVDGDPSTHLWYSTHGAAGQYIGVDLGESVNIGTVEFVQDAGDYWRSYELQYSTDGANYTTHKTYSDAVLNDDLSSANIEARYIRFYCTAGTSTWTKFYEISVGRRADDSAYTNNEAAKSIKSDVKTATAKITGTHELTLAKDEYFGIDLRRIKDLATIAVEEVPTGITLEVSKNEVDWTAVTQGVVMEDARYVRLINKTNEAITFTLSKFEITSNELSAPSLYDSNIGVNSSWGVAEDCRNNGAAFDGDVNTITEFGDFVSKDEYIIYDLGQERNISKLEIYCQDSAVNYIRDAVIAVSNDLENWTDVITIGDGVENTGEANVKCIDSDAGYSQTTSSYPNKVSIEGEIEATKARYIRILMTAANNERAVVFNEIEINNGEYVPVSNDPTFEGALEAQGFEPQKMFDGDLTTAYKPGSTAAGSMTYTLSKDLDVKKMNIVQKGAASDAVVSVLVKEGNEKVWEEAGTLSKSLNEISLPLWDEIYAIKFEWEENKIPTISEIVMLYGEEFESTVRGELVEYMDGLDVKEADYTAASYAAYAAKYAAAEAVLEDNNSSEAALANALKDLQAAVAGLEKRGNIALVEAELAAIAELKEADYTAATWAVLQAAVAEAEELTENANVTETEVEAMVEKLQQAKAALVSNASVGKDALAAYIADNKLNDLVTSDYMSAGAKTFSDALAAANALLEKDATAEQYTKALKDLQDARAALVKKATKAEVDALKTLLDSYKEETYTASSWTAFKAVYDQVKADAEKEQTSEAIAEMTAKLNKAAKDLVMRGDKGTLVTLLEVAKKYDASKYTEESYKGILAVVAKIEKALEDTSELLPEDVKALDEEFWAADKALVEIDSPEEPEEPEQPSQPEQPQPQAPAAPSTGDSANIIGFAVVAIMAAACLLFLKKRKQA